MHEDVEPPSASGITAHLIVMQAAGGSGLHAGQVWALHGLVDVDLARCVSRPRVDRNKGAGMWHRVETMNR